MYTHQSHKNSNVNLYTCFQSYMIHKKSQCIFWWRRVRDCMEVRFMTNYVISAYHY